MALIEISDSDSDSSHERLKTTMVNRGREVSVEFIGRGVSWGTGVCPSNGMEGEGAY